MANILFWMVAQLPQVWKNFRVRDAGALSFGFVFTWLLGDLTNLLGCILTHQLPTQLYTAVYFVAVDVVLVGQWVFYTSARKYSLFGFRPRPHSVMVASRLGINGDGTKEPLLVATTIVTTAAPPAAADPADPP
jgi:uncharacterized protein with PQ loop repeat